MVYVVAEIGVNWDGDFELAKKMMLFAKNADCNAVKFQAYRKETLGNHPESERLMKSSISVNNIEIISSLAKSIGIEWFCTPMYPEAVDLLDPYVQRYKVRVSDGRPALQNNDTELFTRILKTGKPVIVSAESSPRNCKYYGQKNISWLYCVPKYPCDLEDLNFSFISDFDGYSNHCPHISAPFTATILGAQIIEIHITSDKSKSFLDNPVSFDENELKQLMSLIRTSEKIKKLPKHY